LSEQLVTDLCMTGKGLFMIGLPREQRGSHRALLRRSLAARFNALYLLHSRSLLLRMKAVPRDASSKNELNDSVNSLSSAEELATVGIADGSRSGEKLLTKNSLIDIVDHKQQSESARHCKKIEGPKDRFLNLQLSQRATNAIAKQGIDLQPGDRDANNRSRQYQSNNYLTKR
jgi:hypothetical protein